MSGSLVGFCLSLLIKPLTFGIETSLYINEPYLLDDGGTGFF